MEYVDHAIAQYQRVHGRHVPQPTPGASYEVHHAGRHYVVLARDGRRILGLYQVVHGGLRLMGACPSPIRAHHRERVLDHVHATR